MNLREQFDLSEDRGYLPAEDPAISFNKYPHSDTTSAACYLLLNDSKKIPKLLVAGQLITLEFSCYRLTTNNKQHL